jgi:hypothetical protein
VARSGRTIEYFMVGELDSVADNVPLKDRHR